MVCPLKGGFLFGRKDIRRLRKPSRVLWPPNSRV